MNAGDTGFQATPLLFVISGPSGVGKDAVIAGLKGLGHPLYFAVTATTRPMRQGEAEGKDYHFVTRSEFERMIAGGELLEYADVYGHFYGVPKRELKQGLDRGQDVVVKVDVQGAATIRKMLPEAVFLFVAPPSMKDLEGRLKRRKTEAGVDLEFRVKAAQEEMNSLPMFDYVVVNHEGKVGLAVSQIESIITAEKCRVKARTIEI
ncbi:MAG TPA: guanylate kinase [Dehalococcoidia bacterium]|nr:guanylate kinase [Dehalococcoidia bacterium]